MDRIFESAKFFQPVEEGEPIRSVVTESQNAVVVSWYVKPGQTIPPHRHPNGQDTWTILTGGGKYYLDTDNNSTDIVAGDVVVARIGDIHGVFNDGDEPLTFISVVTPYEAGYERVHLDHEF
jgi:quercetin dioxygenase-like cupin family protein